MTRINLKNLIVLLLPALASLGQAEVIDNSAQRTILMVDDHHILYRAGTVRKLNPLQRYSDKPIISADKPWETTWFDGAELSYAKHIFSQFFKKECSSVQHISRGVPNSV